MSTKIKLALASLLLLASAGIASAGPRGAAPVARAARAALTAPR